MKSPAVTATALLRDAFRRALDRGVTDRVYPGGSRPMVHRWHHSKIKGARPLSAVFIENIYNSSPIMRALLKRGPFRQHTPPTR